ncbi:Enhancer of mRNA-decapping protein 4 [Echinococcus granulosus]|nr:Enhancer of mRNA-decapping protein 4 [Echinococcus granulosus]
MKSFAEKILLDGNGYEEFFGIRSSSVDIVASPASAITANGKSSSSSLMITPLVSYDWEYKYYPTKLLTSHATSGNIAWFIKGQSKALVRITHSETRVRSLLKNFDSDFLTLDFSPYFLPILAVLSFDGILNIYHVNHIDAVNNLLISINLHENSSTLTHCALKWGPKSTTPEDHKDSSLLLAAALNRDVYIVDLNGVIEQLSSGPIDFHTASVQYHLHSRLLTEILVRLSTYDNNIEAMEFAADASTIFISVNIGQILVFKLSDIKSESFSPYREWTMPGTSSFSSLHYVNYKSMLAPEGYLIGGANFNRELFLWRLPDCSLVQTIRFCPSEGRDQKDSETLKSSPQPMLITHFSATANLLLASDIKRTSPTFRCGSVCVHSTPQTMPNKSKRAKISTNMCTCGLLSGEHGNNSNRGKTFSRTRERSLLRCRRSTPRAQASIPSHWSATPVGCRSYVAPLRKRGRPVRARQASYTVAVKRRRRQRNVKPTALTAGSSLKVVEKEVGKGNHASEESQKSETQPLKNHLSVDTLPEPSPCSNESNAVLYALHLSRNPDNPEEVQFRCVTEFLLVSPCIAFDVSRVSRSLSLDRPFAAYVPEDSDNIEAQLNLIHPRELKTGKLSFFVPLGIYMQRDKTKKEEQFATEPPLDNDPLSTVGTVGNCSSPLLPEGNKSSIFSSSFNVFTKMFNRRPTSASSRPYTPPPNGDVPSVPPPTENSLSVDSNTPQATSELEATPTGQSFGGGDNCGSGNDEGESFQTVGRISDAELANEDPIVATAFRSGSTCSFHTSATDPSQLPFRGMGGLSKASELSDSVRSLAGSSSVASFSNSLCRDPSILDFSRPANGVFAKAMSLSMNQPLSDSVRSLDGSSNDVIATSESLKSLQIHPIATPTTSSTECGASGDSEVIQLLKSLLAETKAQAASIKTLTNKVHENKNQLTKLANVQATILKQVNALTPSPVSTSATASTPTSPSWANHLVDQVRKQKAETTKQLMHLETVLNNIQTSTASMVPTKKPQAASLLDAKQMQTLQEQTRNVIRTEIQNVFQSNAPIILEPLRQHLRVSLEEMLGPLPKTVADRMLSVIIDPKFNQYFLGQMSTTIAPSMTIAYREELRRVLVPAFTKGVDKLTKELDELVKCALNQHVQLVITKIDSGVQSSRDKIDASVRKFDEQVNRLSKDIAAKVTTQMNESLKVASQQSQLLKADIAMPSALEVGGAMLSAATSKDLSLKGSRSAFDTVGGGGSKQQLRNFISGGTSSADSYQAALLFIQNHQYVEALETALTSANQILLLKVLQNVPVVQLFRQNVKQELLLSLIHQLSCGQLQEQLEMKISFLQEAVNHLRMNDDTVKELGDDILSMLVTKITHLQGAGVLTSAEANRALVLLRSVQEKRQNRTHL